MSFSFFPTDSPLEILLDRTLQQRATFKAKSDYVVNPIPRGAIKNLWNSLMEVDAAAITFEPYGGKMAEIPESQLPFPHRKGSLFNILYVVAWSPDNSTGTNVSECENQICWIRRLYKNMAPYVSKYPRAAYVNYRDLDLGGRINESYSMAEVWGRKYFKSNFRRLALVKGEVDPDNFFGNEQSIPPLLV
ncbi:hypothetical protein J5N97_004635 [Dioscorea zingiberensis]|nr:hypothetical protein J5N97_004635 [Dioscorea zingiberensis]